MHATKSLATLAAFMVCAASALAQAPAQPAPPAVAGPAGLPAAPSARPFPTPSALGESVLTVEQWLSAENEIARAEVQKARIAAGLTKPVAFKGPNKPVPLDVTVESIFGHSGALKATLRTADGQRFEGVGPGSRVKNCEVVRIVDRCVVLRAPAISGRRAAGPTCPTACWTGERPQPAAAALAGMPPLPPGGPAGMPLPTPQPPATPAPIPPAPVAAK